MNLNNTNLYIPGMQINQHFQLQFESSDIGSQQLFVPDGLLAIIYLHKGSFSLQGESKINTYHGPDLLYTIYLNPHMVLPHTECEFYGLTIYPLLGGDISHDIKYIHDGFISCKDLAPKNARTLLDRLAHETDPSRIQSILQACAYEPLRAESKISSAVSRVNHVLSHIKKNASSLAVSDLADYSNASLRTLQKDFKDYLGISIKECINLYKFNTFRKSLHQGFEDRLYHLAYDTGYYDQSHLVRHFKRYTGISPKTYLTNQIGMDMAHSFYFKDLSV